MRSINGGLKMAPASLAVDSNVDHVPLPSPPSPSHGINKVECRGNHHHCDKTGEGGGLDREMNAIRRPDSSPFEHGTRVIIVITFHSVMFHNPQSFPQGIRPMRIPFPPSHPPTLLLPFFLPPGRKRESFQLPGR